MVILFCEAAAAAHAKKKLNETQRDTGRPLTTAKEIAIKLRKLVPAATTNSHLEILPLPVTLLQLGKSVGKLGIYQIFWLNLIKKF